MYFLYPEYTYILKNKIVFFFSNQGYQTNLFAITTFGLKNTNDSVFLEKHLIKTTNSLKIEMRKNSCFFNQSIPLKITKLPRSLMIGASCLCLLHQFGHLLQIHPTPQKKKNVGSTNFTPSLLPSITFCFKDFWNRHCVLEWNGSLWYLA